MPLSNAIAIRSDKHAKYWFNDGSVIVTIHRTLSDRAQEEATVLFKLHSSLLARHSTYFGRVLKGSGIDEGEPLVSDNSRISRVTVPPGLGVRVEEFVSLLEHLYHDTSLRSSACPPPSQLDFPDLHALVRSYLEAMFPSGPFPFTHPNHLEEALALTTAYDIRSIRKGIYYSLVTTTDFETEEVEVRSFPTTPHMACTDVFADQWMSLVIPSAISDGGVYKPLETLESIKQLDWAAEGLCPACVREKREEWTEEQAVVWEKLLVEPFHRRYCFE
ncbi:hypothetical protein F5J12DRAFT_785160 [Pisolithus orientalis]|uniref:uncharacterized protein n=1 Tax=Pisolithus orientalis TaxID=936130 RepID=UPI0022243224|nr:uncharacterized protein F5J12DRAFT_785160 [Pisolithus orientalis]KAI5997701.1 hypothetical protein F5J12DRAFT_785160 [Pisolithus orientalis]